MPKLRDASPIHIEINKYLKPDQAMLLDAEVAAQMQLAAIDHLFGQMTDDELQKKIAVLAGSAVRDRKVVLIKNIGKGSGNHGEAKNPQE